VGQVISRKGVEDFISVAHLLPGLDFLWIGPQVNRLIYYNHHLSRLINHPSANLRFLGYVPDVERAYNGADLFFFPSHKESLGLVVLEAASVGLPLVVRDLPVYRGWLEKSPTVRKGTTPEEFALAIAELIKSRTPVEHSFVKEHHLPRVGERLIEAYEAVIK